jgi:hypothetical protein
VEVETPSSGSWIGSCINAFDVGGIVGVTTIDGRCISAAAPAIVTQVAVRMTASVAAT